MRGIHLALTLELDPHAIVLGARKGNVKLNLRPTVGDERVDVDHIDQVLARDQGVSPGPEQLLETVAGGQLKMQLRLEARQRLRRLGLQIHTQIGGVFGRVIASQLRSRLRRTRHHHCLGD